MIWMKIQEIKLYRIGTILQFILAFPARDCKRVQTKKKLQKVFYFMIKPGYTLLSRENCGNAGKCTANCAIILC